MTIDTDASGRAIGFAHHDGSVVSLTLEDNGRSFRIRLRSVSGQENVLLLSGVRALRVDGLREGNIVHAIRLHSVPAARAALDLPPLVRDRLGCDVATLPSEAFVFLLEPSYGAEVVAVCGDVRLNPDA